MDKNGKNSRKTKSSRIPPGLFRLGLLLLAFLMGGVFFHTWCGVKCIRTGYQISEAGQRQEELLEMQKNLKIELARLTAPQTLSRLAENRFELITPETEHIVVIP